MNGKQQAMIIQLAGTILILAFVPSNVGKLVAFLIWWGLTFRRISRAECIFAICASAFFTYMDYKSLTQGIFWFNRPDFLLMPMYEPLLWPYLLINLYRTMGGPAPKTPWHYGLIMFLVLCAPYTFITNQTILFVVTLAIVGIGLLAFREQLDRSYAMYFVVVGCVWEYAGVWSGQWSYPNPPLGGVPPWFATTFAGVALSFRRMVIPLFAPRTNLSRGKNKVVATSCVA